MNLEEFIDTLQKYKDDGCTKIILLDEKAYNGWIISPPKKIEVLRKAGTPTIGIDIRKNK